MNTAAEKARVAKRPTMLVLFKQDVVGTSFDYPPVDADLDAHIADLMATKLYCEIQVYSQQCTLKLETSWRKV